MAIDEAGRHRLYESLRVALGDEEARTLMEYLPPVGWADVATKRDLQPLADRAELQMALHDQTTRIVTWMIALWTTSVAVSLAAALSLR